MKYFYSHALLFISVLFVAGCGSSDGPNGSDLQQSSQTPNTSSEQTAVPTVDTTEDQPTETTNSHYSFPRSWNWITDATDDSEFFYLGRGLRPSLQIMSPNTCIVGNPVSRTNSDDVFYVLRKYHDIHGTYLGNHQRAPYGHILSLSVVVTKEWNRILNPTHGAHFHADDCGTQYIQSIVYGGRASVQVYLRNRIQNHQLNRVNEIRNLNIVLKNPSNAEFQQLIETFKSLTQAEHVQPFVRTIAL